MHENEKRQTGFRKPGKQEIVITRVFNAPRDLVFEVWTNPEHIVHWRGPNGFLGPSGASYPFAFLIISIVILLSGPMILSVDNLIFKQDRFISK